MCCISGIRVIVITGDQRGTAESICRRIGVFDADENLQGKSFTGGEFQQMSETQKNEAVKSASLFCGVIPKHKLELVTLLQKQGEVVAMTGGNVQFTSYYVYGVCDSCNILRNSCNCYYW